MAWVPFPQQKPLTQNHLVLRMQGAPIMVVTPFNIKGDAAMFVVTKLTGYVTTGKIELGT